MATPPAISPPPAPESVREALLAELRSLDTSELLALCHRFSQSKPRLATYLSVLRTRTTTKDALAASVVCFELAKLGDAQSQREFLAMAPSLRGFADEAAVVESLVGDDPYLARGWADVVAALRTSDPRDAWRNLEAGAAPVREVELFDADELVDDVLELDLEELPEAPETEAQRAARAEAQRAEFGRALLQHLGHQPARGIIRPGYGFTLETGPDLDRFEDFLALSASNAAFVPTAAGLHSFARLFLATHLRQKSVFGDANPRRLEALRTGLAALPDSADAVEAGAAVFQGEGDRVLFGFQKVLELLLDFLRFCLHANADPKAAATVEAYVAADRTPEPVLLVGDSRRRR